MSSRRISNRLAGAELVGVVSTYYKSPKDPRFELALENAENWRDNSLPYVVIDASPEEEDGAWVADAHKARGAIVVRAVVPGIATQRLEGVKFAFDHGAEKVVGHEPEKVRMSNFSSEIATGLDRHNILIIGRTAIAEMSLPSVQRRTERFAGWVLEQTHDLPHDTLSGGRGFDEAGAEILARYPATELGMNNWIYLYRTPIEAREAGLSVGGIDVDLVHPEIMTAQEEGNEEFDRKRYDQLKLQLAYMLSRNDVDPSAKPLADAIIQALNGLTALSSNAEFEAKLTKLEARLAQYGYRA